MPNLECPMTSSASASDTARVGAMTDLGPVAPNYDELHRIDLLAKAIGSRQVPPGTYESTACAIFQASEVGLLNLARVASRVSASLCRYDLALTSRHVEWSVGFHRLMRKLGASMFTIRSVFGADVQHSDEPRFSICDTASYEQFLRQLEAMDRTVQDKLLQGNGFIVRATLATRHLDDDLYRILHGLRISYHDATKWESDLSDIVIPTEQSIGDLTSSDVLAHAVAATELHPDSLHGEFVALHQIPEILCAESNDHLEFAIRALRRGELSRTVAHLATCRSLLEPMVEAQRVMAELLATAEYHEFRENLGPASGTHSLAIKQHMFKDLFKHLWNNLESWLGDSGQGSLNDAIHHLEAHQHDDSAAWLRHCVLDEAFRLHGAHQEWRHEHLHMPRNCLGSGGTKSMIGVPDGPQVVYKMRDAANSQHSLVALHEARRIRLSNALTDSTLAHLVTNPESIDAQIMRVVGEATRDYFPEVQEQSYRSFHSHAPERTP